MTDGMITDMENLHLNSYQIPIDGNEKHHDTIKCTESKGETFRQVINNINMLADIVPNVNITLRINYDKKTLYRIEDIILLISENAKKHIHVDFQKVWQIECNKKDKKRLKFVKDLF